MIRILPIAQYQHISHLPQFWRENSNIIFDRSSQQVLDRDLAKKTEMLQKAKKLVKVCLFYIAKQSDLISI